MLEQVTREIRVPKGHRESKAIPEIPDRREIQDPKEIQGPQAQKEIPAIQDPKGRREFKEFKV